MHRYFKLVALNSHRGPDWMLEEFRQGRVRFGWSGPSSDLRVIQAKPRQQRTPEENTTWRYTQFLLNRLRSGDRVVLQFEQPLRRILICEVTDEGYDSTAPKLEDFNHVLNCRPLTEQYIPINADYVPAFLKHDLSKRGQYYEIYPERSRTQLDEIVAMRPWLDARKAGVRSEQDELDATWDSVKAHAIAEIARRWPGKAFETFCARLCERIPYIEVKELKDRGQGWDMLLRINDPISGEELPGYGNVPAQCKSYTGAVTTSDPINDLVRCATADIACSVAYLFILGRLTDEFQTKLETARSQVQAQSGREVEFHIIDQDRIAELYLQYFAQSLPAAVGPS